jgi:protein pelota
LNIKSRKYQYGQVTLVPETVEDLYVLYNVILPGNQVKGRTYRRIRKKGDEEGRADKGERISMVLTLEVEEAKFHEFVNRLRVKGKIIEGPEDLISLGSYHTINVEKGTLLTIFKDRWTQLDIDRLEEATKKTSEGKVLVVAIDDGEATIAAIGQFNSNIIAHFKENIPRKGGGKEKIRNEIIKKFFAKLTFAIEEALETKAPEALAMVLAGPGFTKDNYLKYLKEANKSLKIPFDKIIIETASCGGPSAIGEIVSKNILGKIIEDEEASSEAAFIEEVMTRLGKNTGTVAYGTEQINKAVDYGAIETLLVVDRELRLRDNEKRKQLEGLLSAVQKQGGKVKILSEHHEAGKQLIKFGGKIALLRYPLM